MAPPTDNQHTLPLWVRSLFALFCLGVIAELTIHQWPHLIWERTWYGQLLYAFAYSEAWSRIHPRTAGTLFLAAFISVPVLYRKWLRRRSDAFTRRATGLDDELEAASFPVRSYDPRPFLTQSPPGLTFVGVTPTRRLLPPWGHNLKPVYLSEEERSMHRHVLGKTGSGKTTSILWPQVFQDVRAGKGVLVVDAKGSDENARMMRDIAFAAGREADLRLFSLPAWNRPNVFSHTYNMVYVRPGTRDDVGGDVAAMAERVFGVIYTGDHPFFRDQSQLGFTRICRLLHRLVGADGHALSFTLQDVGICLRGIGVASKSPYAKALAFVLAHSLDRDAGEELAAQVDALGKEAGPAFSGLLAAVDRFQSPLVNAATPDLNFEEALQHNRLVYVQAPSNLYKLQAAAVVKVMLMDLQQEASLRQVYRAERNQRPFAVVIDEFGSFADLSFVDSLNKLRDANIQFTLSHQSIADLELVSKEFAQAVMDNTRTRDVLALDNPELCERMAKSLGTRTRLEHTVQQGPDDMALVTATGMMSTRAVEAYRLHPNRLKTLAARGQGFLFATRRGGSVAIPVLYTSLPPLESTSSGELPRNEQRGAEALNFYERFVKKAQPSARVQVLRFELPQPSPRQPQKEKQKNEERHAMAHELDDVPSVG